MPSQASPSRPAYVNLLLLAIDELLGIQKAAEDALMNAKDSEREFTADERVALRRYEEGLQKTLDLIAPGGMEVKRDELVLNDLHSRTLFVYNWPNYAFPNWLSETLNFDAQMEISQYIYPASNKVILKMLRKKVAEMRSSIRMLEQRGIVRDPALEAALQDAEELRDLLARGREKLFQFGMYITIYAEDAVKLKKLQTDMESILGGKLMLTKPAMFQMEHAWISTLPLCLDELDINRNMNTSPLATSFPFSSPDLTDDHGILYGINRHNDSLVIFDRFDLPNANATVFATSGAGKSFTVKLEILRSLMFGTDVFVIDPENEYVELCKTVGGTFIPLSLQSSFRINPFDLPKAVRGDEALTGETLRSAAITLHGLFKLMLGTLTPAEDGVLDKAILDTYALKGITLQTPDPSKITPPTLGDLVDVLKTTEGGEHMAQTLKKYTEGSFAGLFDQPTNVELNNTMIVFQIRDLEEQLRPIAMYVVLNFLWNRIRADFKKRFLVIDEAWNLMQHEDSARFLYGLIKRARKYWLGVTTITQDVEDFVNSPYGKPIITNAALQILLKQSATAVDNLQKLFYLTDGEKYLLLNSDVGQGLFFAGNKHVAIQVVASPKEQSIITTKPEEVAAMLNYKREEKNKEKKPLIPPDVTPSATPALEPTATTFEMSTGEPKSAPADTAISATAEAETEQATENAADASPPVPPAETPENTQPNAGEAAAEENTKK
ncbi:MAG: ATP-binding protein [Candidatus Peribacteraceae bacterium]|nr:ATP-binding protein [Candidatus Peribacteraceae bacterium]MDD5742626.1 ATP-binding protein [Candidatus Peribacteraceae bacterium]